MIGAPDDNYRPSSYYCRVRGASACGNVGAVNILYTANGLNAAGDQFFNQNIAVLRNWLRSVTSSGRRYR